LTVFSSKANSPDDSTHSTEETADMQTVLGALQQLLVPELCNTVVLLALDAAKGPHGAHNSESVTLFPTQQFDLFVQWAVKGDHRPAPLAVNTVLFVQWAVKGDHRPAPLAVNTVLFRPDNGNLALNRRN
jgi:hypothetical protein